MCLALVGLVASAQAQDCRTFTKTPPVGSWAEWRELGSSLRQSVLGQEMREGNLYVRMEYQMSVDDTPAMVYQTLVPPDRPEAPEEIIVKVGRSIAMKVLKENFRKAGFELDGDPGEACTTSMTLIGEKMVTVPAGTFATSHYKDAETGRESWLSPQVPFGIVKFNGGGKDEMMLAAYGTGATSAITEAPIDMPRD